MGMHIVLVGEMGVGKTTVGGLLADELEMPFLDSDVVIESKFSETGAAIANRDGVARLHQLELEVFLDMCRATERSVIAPAASVVDHEDGRRALAEHLTVWLTAPDEVLATRQGGHRRVVEAGEREVLRRRRAPYLKQLAHLTVDTSRTPPGTVARGIALTMQMNGDI
jgi:shikimate kinase